MVVIHGFGTVLRKNVQKFGLPPLGDELPAPGAKGGILCSYVESGDLTWLDGKRQTGGAFVLCVFLQKKKGPLRSEFFD